MSGANVCHRDRESHVYSSTQVATAQISFRCGCEQVMMRDRGDKVCVCRFALIVVSTD
jgi:hypothetical protein